MGKTFKATVLASTTALTMAISGPAVAGGVLKLAVADWTGGAVACQILANVLEMELDYKIKHITIPSGTAVFEAMAAGDIDVGCEMWPSYNPAKGDFFIDYGGEHIETLGENGVIGASSYYVPRYLVEGDNAPAKGLKTFADLADHVEVFKTLETGDKGRLIGCPAANWQCEDQARADANGVPFEAVALGSETAHWAEMQGAFKRGEPLAYAWEPHWIHAELDLVALELDENTDGACWPKCGWPQDVTINYGRTGLADEHPEAAAMITKSSISNAMQNAIVLEIDVKGRDIEEVVEEWMAANESVWKSWLQ